MAVRPMDFIIRPAGIGIGIRTCSGGSPHQTKNGDLRRAGVSIETGTRTETGSGGSHHPRVKSGVRPRNRHRMLSLAQDASTRTRRKNKNCLSCKTFSKLRQIPQASTCIRAYRKIPLQIPNCSGIFLQGRSFLYLSAGNRLSVAGREYA